MMFRDMPKREQKLIRQSTQKEIDQKMNHGKEMQNWYVYTMYVLYNRPPHRKQH